MKDKRDFWKYVSLNVLGMLGISCYILADTFFIAGKLGATGLAALNFALPVYCLVNATGLMLGIGGGSHYAIQKARGEEGNTTYTHTVLQGLFFGLLFILVGLLFSTPIASTLGAAGEAHAMTATYLQVILLFAPCFILNNITLAFVRNDGAPKLSMVAMLAGSLSNIFLDWFFMYPLSMGIFGAVFATGLSPVISLAVLSFHFKKSTLRLKAVKLHISLMGKILSLGLSTFITELSSGISLLVFNLVIFRLTGNDGVAAYGVIANIALVVIGIFTGIAQGTQPLVSRAKGLQKSGAPYLKAAGILSICLSLFIYAVAIFFQSELTGIFNSEGNPQLQALAVEGIGLYFLGFFPAGLNIILAAFLSAGERVKSAFCIAVSRGFALLVPTVLLFSFSMTGVWLAYPITEILTLAGFLVFHGISRASRSKSKAA